MSNKSEIENKDAWLKTVRRSMDDYSAPLPPGGWQRLEHKLPLPFVENPGKAHRAWMPWLRVAAAAVLLTAVVSSALFFLRTPQAEQMRKVSEAESVRPLLQELVNPSEPTMVTEKKLESAMAYVAPKVVTPVVKVEPAVEVKEVNPTTEETTVESELPVTKKTPKVHRPTKRTESVMDVPKEKRNGWSVALAATSGTGISGSGGSEFGPLASPSSGDYASSISDMGVMNDGIITVPDDMTLSFKGGVPYLYKTNYTYHHKQPISFGLSVRKDLNHGFSAEAGVNYTLLSSDVEVNGHKTIEQQLHYVGVPVRLNWSFVQADRYNVYVGAGATVEKCVYGKVGSEKLTIDPLQLSLNGAVGAQYNVIKHLGVYAEVGVSHYFDDGSEVQTIRKENKLNLNLQLGLRLHY